MNTSLAQDLKEQGTLVTRGPTEGSSHVFGILRPTTFVVRKLVKDDIYWKHGIWISSRFIPGSRRFEPAAGSIPPQATPSVLRTRRNHSSAAPFSGDRGDGSTVAMSSRSRASVLGFPAANDVATVDVASRAVLFEQHSSPAGVLNGSGCCFRTPQVHKQQQNCTKQAAQDIDQHRDFVALISLLEQVMRPVDTAGSVHRESGSPAEGTYEVCSGNPSRPCGEWS